MKNKTYKDNYQFRMKVYVLTGMPPYEGRINTLGVYGSIESLEEAKEYYESHLYRFLDWDEFEVE